jgi:hypothetical protein
MRGKALLTTATSLKKKYLVARKRLTNCKAKFIRFKKIFTIIKKLKELNIGNFTKAFGKKQANEN